MPARDADWDRFLGQSSKALGQSLALQKQLNHMTAHYYAHWLNPVCPPAAPQYAVPPPVIVQPVAHPPTPVSPVAEQPSNVSAMVNMPAVAMHPQPIAVMPATVKEPEMRSDSDWKLTVLMMMGAVGLTIAVFIVLILSGLLTAGGGGG